jgi:hypothetical protein
MSILAAMLLPALMSAAKSARAAQCSNQIRQITTSFMYYSDDNNGYPPTPVIGAYWSATLAGGSYYITGFWMDDFAKMYDIRKPFMSEKFGGSIFQCPEQPSWRFFNNSYRTSYGANIYCVAGQYNNNDLVTKPGAIKKMFQLRRPSRACWLSDDYGDPQLWIPKGEGYLYDDDSANSVWGGKAGIAFRHGKTQAAMGFYDGHIESRHASEVPTRQYWVSPGWDGPFLQTWFVNCNRSSSNFKGM